ncbi:F-box protein SKIP23 [Citrus sinensis]|uniref:F-box protein SKIP23 n=1 Tax=Citrus sinensis TaxID=2711 RepID=A0ACB8J095_CITSI|nr:F-box protein SKIP23 [Citrus sinensis]
MKKSKTKLCDLPDVLLSSIIEKLETQSNALRLRASCRKFQPLIPPLPKTLLERQSLNIPLPFASSSSSDNNHFHYSLIESKVFAIRPRSEDASESATTCWFIKVQESNSGQVRLMDPLSRFGFENASDKLKLPKCLNMLDYEVKELAQDFELEVVDKDENKVDETYFLIKKVVVSEDFEIMAMHDSGKVSVWRKGDINWTSIRLDLGNNCMENSFEDIIYYKKKFYVTNRRGVTLYVDCKTLTVMFAATPDPLRGLSDGLNYLVKSDKHLYLLVKCWIRMYLCRDNKPYLKLHPTRFQLLKLDEEKNMWVDFDLISENRVFFVGEGCCFSVGIGVGEFAGTLKRNCVYFSDSAFANSDDVYPGWTSAVFDFDDYEVWRFSKFPSHSRIFWPPPAWIKLQD